MARIRYLKPEFFFDDELAGLPFVCRLFFQGLWCHADREGRLENKPKILKAKIFPYDPVKVDQLLDQLDGKFISLYEVDGRKYIQINNFGKHQKPHHTEKKSTIPEFNGYLTVKERLEPGRNGNGNGNGEGNGKEKKNSPKKDSGIVFLRDFFRKTLWPIYPNKSGKQKAEKYFLRTVKDQETAEDLKIVVECYLEHLKKETWKQPQDGKTFFNNWQDWKTKFIEEGVLVDDGT